MTYKKEIPELVFKRWKTLNENYRTDFSFDNDCIQFLKENFNDYIVELFKTIPRGMYKADLWRLCKLYVNSGVYADVDLVPYLNIDSLDKNITFYSCLSLWDNSIFQAFMVNFSKPKNPLILCFLISFLLNNPYTYNCGPTYDMFNCIKYNLNNINIEPYKKYELEEIKIIVDIGSSETNTKHVDLHFFPQDIEYNIKLVKNHYDDDFFFNIHDNKLIVKRLDDDFGWGHHHSAEICIKSKESIYLFKENNNSSINSMTTCYVTNNQEKILDSRDLNYHVNGGW